MKAQEIGTRCFVFHTTLKLDCKTVRIFAYSSTREQSNEAENRERDWGETLKKTLRKALLADCFRINVKVKPNIKINTS